MGFIKEPEGIDFIIQSRPLTEKEKKELSEYIKAEKEKEKNKLKAKSRPKTSKPKEITK